MEEDIGDISNKPWDFIANRSFDPIQKPLREEEEIHNQAERVGTQA